MATNRKAEKERNLLTREERVGKGAKSYDGEKAWSSVIP
jgi:hypothetical protein